MKSIDVAHQFAKLPKLSRINKFTKLLFYIFNHYYILNYNLKKNVLITLHKFLKEIPFRFLTLLQALNSAGKRPVKGNKKCLVLLSAASVNQGRCVDCQGFRHCLCRTAET